MPALLSQEWLDRQREETAELPTRPGASARIGYRVTDRSTGDVDFHVVLDDGRITESGLGPLDDADFTMQMPRPTFVEVVRGELDPNVGFMQGRIKVVGDIGKLMSVLPATVSDDWAAAMRRVCDATEF